MRYYKKVGAIPITHPTNPNLDTWEAKWKQIHPEDIEPGDTIRTEVEAKDVRRARRDLQKIYKELDKPF